MPAIPLRTDYDGASVRAWARLAGEAQQVRRLLAIAAVYDGLDRATAARLGGMDRQTLRDWVHRFNEEGPEGLVDRKAPGAARRLRACEEAELIARSMVGLHRATSCAIPSIGPRKVGAAVTAALGAAGPSARPQALHPLMVRRRTMMIF